MQQLCLCQLPLEAANLLLHSLILTEHAVADLLKLCLDLKHQQVANVSKKRLKEQ